MIAEYSVTLENKTKSELIIFINELQDMLKERDKEIEKKDKIIDLMTEQLAGLTIWDNEKEEPLILTDKEHVKQYFEQKATNNG